MTNFPDESTMTTSPESGDLIRGGSIGFNRIFNFFVQASVSDNRPRFHGVLISAFTIIRNIWSKNSDATLDDYERGFVQDVNLFNDYFDAYLSHVWNRLPTSSFVPVVIYFPDYRHLAKDLRREHSGKQAVLYDHYQQFLNHHGNHNKQVRTLDHCRCFWIDAGGNDYPHKDLLRKFREITSHRDCAYSSGDPVCLITSNPLDLYLAARLRGVQLLESYTAALKKPEDFRFKLDKDGRVPFYPVIHGMLGDSFLVKPGSTGKVKKAILDTASGERWATRSEDDVRHRIAKLTGLSLSDLRRYDFA